MEVVDYPHAGSPSDHTSRFVQPRSDGYATAYGNQIRLHARAPLTNPQPGRIVSKPLADMWATGSSKSNQRPLLPLVISTVGDLSAGAAARNPSYGYSASCLRHSTAPPACPWPSRLSARDEGGGGDGEKPDHGTLMRDASVDGDVQRPSYRRLDHRGDVRLHRQRPVQIGQVSSSQQFPVFHCYVLPPFL